MNSKESLERIKDIVKGAVDVIADPFTYSESAKIINLCETIKQDLDRLEKLEKIFSDSHICEIKARFNEIECCAEKCENCPLGFSSGVCLKNTFEKKWELQLENEKFKKTIEILKDKFCLELNKENNKLYFDTYECDIDETHPLYDKFYFRLTQEQYELLEEVLE